MNAVFSLKPSACDATFSEGSQVSSLLVEDVNVPRMIAQIRQAAFNPYQSIPPDADVIHNHNRSTSGLIKEQFPRTGKIPLSFDATKRIEIAVPQMQSVLATVIRIVPGRPRATAKLFPPVSAGKSL